MKFLLVKVVSPEAVACSCSLKKVFLENLQNSQENTCARVSFLIKLQASACSLIKKGLWHRCFPVNFAKFQGTLFLIENSGSCFCRSTLSTARNKLSQVFLSLYFTANSAKYLTSHFVHNRFWFSFIFYKGKV